AHLRRDRAAGTGDVLDDDRPAEVIGQPLGRDTRGDIGAGTRTTGHDQVDRRGARLSNRPGYAQRRGDQAQPSGGGRGQQPAAPGTEMHILALSGRSSHVSLRGEAANLPRQLYKVKTEEFAVR